MPNIEEPLKTKRESVLFRFIKKMAQSEINRATKNRESVKKKYQIRTRPLQSQTSCLLLPGVFVRCRCHP